MLHGAGVLQHAAQRGVACRGSAPPDFTAIAMSLPILRELLRHLVPAREHRVLACLEDASHGCSVPLRRWTAGRRRRRESSDQRGGGVTRRASRRPRCDDSAAGCSGPRARRAARRASTSRGSASKTPSSLSLSVMNAPRSVAVGERDEPLDVAERDHRREVDVAREPVDRPRQRAAVDLGGGHRVVDEAIAVRADVREHRGRHRAGVDAVDLEPALEQREAGAARRRAELDRALAGAAAPAPTSGSPPRSSPTRATAPRRGSGRGRRRRAAAPWLRSWRCQPTRSGSSGSSLGAR